MLDKLGYSSAINATIDTGLLSTFAMAPKTREGFFAEQHTVIPPVVTVVVVWANVGAGFEALKHFARMNPGLLVVACRNQGRGKEAVLCELLVSEL